MAATYVTILTSEGVARVAFVPKLTEAQHGEMPRILEAAKQKTRRELRDELRQLAARWKVAVTMDQQPIQ